MVPFRRLSRSTSPIDDLFRELKVQIVPFDETRALIAREAYRRYGKGHHPAALNFGDCFSYALAKHLNEPPAL